MAKRQPKRQDLLNVIKNHVDAGTVRYSDHAFLRGRGRSITITEPEARYVLRHGWHEKRQDRYEEQYWHPWTYSIRGKTVDERRLRVAVTFEMDES